MSPGAGNDRHFRRVRHHLVLHKNLDGIVAGRYRLVSLLGRVPQRGDKRDLLETVTRNAEQALTMHKVKRAGDLTSRSQALEELQEALGLPEAPLRIECVDVSHLQGTDVVASLVVYLLPLVGIACFGLLLSTVTRNSAASVVGTLMFALLMQLIGALPGTEPIRPYLLSAQFSAWHGFLRVPADFAPVTRAFSSASQAACASARVGVVARVLPRKSIATPQ